MGAWHMPCRRWRGTYLEEYPYDVNGTSGTLSIVLPCVHTSSIRAHLYMIPARMVTDAVAIQCTINFFSDL